MATISDTAARALYDAVAHRGKHKGQLLARCPLSSTLAAAAWQAAMINCNPYKASVCALLFFDANQRAVYEEINAIFEANPTWRFADRDRLALSSLGVW